MYLNQYPMATNRKKTLSLCGAPRAAQETGSSPCVVFLTLKRGLHWNYIIMFFLEIGCLTSHMTTVQSRNPEILCCTFLRGEGKCLVIFIRGTLLGWLSWGLNLNVLWSIHLRPWPVLPSYYSLPWKSLQRPAFCFTRVYFICLRAFHVEVKQEVDRIVTQMGEPQKEAEVWQPAGCWGTTRRPLPK